MAGDADTTTAGGGDGTPSGSGQNPPASTAGGGSGGPPDNSQGGAGAAIDRSKLNPLISNLGEDQLNEVFETLFTAARNANSGVPAHAREPEPKAPAAPQYTRDELREMMDPSSDKFDPEAAILQVTSKNYGNLIQDLGTKALSAVELSVRQQFPDFDQYKGGIDQILRGRDPSTISQADMVGAYFMAVGAQKVEQERKERLKPPTTQPPSPAKDDATATPKLSADEERAARIMFPEAADPNLAYTEAVGRMTKGVTKVPGDKK